MMVRVFANGLGDLGSIPGRVIPKTQKIVLEAALFNTQHYKVWIKSRRTNYSTGNWQDGQSVRQWPGRPGFNPGSSHTEDSKNST